MKILADRENASEVRASAAWSLGQSQDPALVSAMSAAVKDNDKKVRDSAAAGLCRNLAPWVVRPLSVALSDPDSGFSLSDCTNGPIDDVLAQELSAPDARRRTRAARALQDRLMMLTVGRPLEGGPLAGALQAMLDALRRRDVTVTGAAAGFYIAWGEPGSEASLIQALEHISDDIPPELFLVSGNAKLEDAGRAWMTSRGRPVRQSTIGVLWGELRVVQERLASENRKPSL
jgi:hypothetical protein